MSSSIPVSLPRINLGNTYGAFLIGAIFAALLFGLTNIQAFIYYQTHAGRWTKFYRLVVFWLWILDASHLALIVHCVYYYLVTNYGNTSVLTEVVWSFKLQIVFNAIISYGIHLLYSHRIWIVGRDRSRIFRMIPGIVVVVGLGVAVSLTWIVYRRNPPIDLFQIGWPTFMALGTAASLDILVASSLCYLLATSRTGFPKTDGWITKLIGYTIDSGCLTSICSITAIITCAAMPHNFVFLGVQFLLAKLYVNSYIALLNARYYMLSNTDTGNSSEQHICLSDTLSTGTHDGPQEKFQTYRRGMFTRAEHEVVLPTRPVQVAMLHRSILVTVEKQSFAD
ncbi:uncharacterized protein EDB91DRAFT_651926 [Suillus paluster]|uniref:uncharacterized protein n=1 Tax=Suillus paluster TaxID=48578 RepID=UPI001B87540E|nr:uncharacterized protein EDB91DRAFT_651926 [Suillus paluster]KAG1733035.1 hypothetical protein EDB91DRAFT_651926 [Suillus paluster]